MTSKRYYYSTIFLCLISSLCIGQRKKLVMNIGSLAAVYSICFSPNGDYIAFGSDDHRLKIWDTKAGILSFSLKGHTQLISSVSFSPDGQYLASGSWDHSIRIWETSTGRLLHTLSDHQAEVTSVSFSPDGTRLVSASRDKTIKLWSAQKGELLHTFSGHKDWVTSVAFSPNDHHIVSGSWDKTIKLWSVATGKLVNTFKKGHHRIISVTFSPDGNYIASGSYDKRIKLWNAQTGKLIRSLEHRSSFVSSLSFSPDGSQIASGNRDNIIKLWDSRTGKLIRFFEKHDAYVHAVSISPDGSYIASGSEDGTIKLWDSQTGRLKLTLYVFNASATAWLVKHNDGHYDASPEGLKLLHYSDGKNDYSLNHQTDPYYVKGLLSQFLHDHQPEENEEKVVTPPLLKWLTSFPKNYSSAKFRGKFSIKAQSSLIFYQVKVNNKEVAERYYHDKILFQDIVQTTVQLENGLNQIEVKVLNKGAQRPSILTAAITYTPVFQQKNYALIIANKSYQDSSVWKKLPNVWKAGDSLKTLLERDYGFDEVRLLRNADKSSIKDAIDAYYFDSEKDSNYQFGPNDQLFIYFAGHGDLDAKKDIAYIVPSNAQGTDYDTYLSHSDLEDNLKNLPCEHVFLFLDACYSGRFGSDYFFAQKSGKPKGKYLYNKEKLEGFITKQLSKKSRLCLASGEKETSAGDDKRYSPFTELLFQALENEKLTKGVIVSFYTLFKIIQEARLNPPPKARTFKEHVSGGSFLFIRQ